MLENVIAIRRSKGISLSQISEATKISRRYLEAIESGRFQNLPGGVYNISYIRQYARAVEISEDDLVAYYRTTIAPDDAPVGKPPSRLQAFEKYATSLLG